MKKKIASLVSHIDVRLKTLLSPLKDKINVFAGSDALQIISRLANIPSFKERCRFFQDIPVLEFLAEQKMPEYKETDPLSTIRISLFQSLRLLNKDNCEDILERLKSNFESLAFETPISVYRGVQGRHIADVFAAIEKGNLAKLRELIADQADLNAKNTMGETPLMQAILLRKFDCFKALIHAGADMDKQDNNLNTALMLAIDYKRMEYAWFLVRSGANRDKRNQLGETAPMMALDRNMIDLVESMVIKGIIMDFSDKKGITLQQRIKEKNLTMSLHLWLLKMHEARKEKARQISNK